LVYPAEEKEAGHQGRVMVQFAINTDGSVSDVKVMRSTGYEALDNEAVRVISSSPNWKPGMVNGQPVKVTFMFPVIYQVRGDKDDPKPAGQTISIRTASGAMPLIILDGVKYIGELSAIDPSTIEKMEVLKDEETIKKYGDEAKNGVILITSKKQ
jgi:TonB family protein